jgi:hypothetical protein
VLQAETRAKARGLALLGSMVAVALGVWYWPARPAVRLPEHALEIAAPVTARAEAAAPAGATPMAPAEETAIARVGEPAPPSAVHSVARAPLPAGPRPAVIAPRIIAVLNTSVQAPLDRPRPALAARRIIVSGVPHAPAGRAALVSSVEPEEEHDGGNPFARAGISIGSAFKKAALKTAGAFTGGE